VASRLGIEPTQPDRVHLEFGRQQVTDLTGLLIATLGEVLHPLFPFAWRPQPRAPVRLKVTVSAKSAANVLPALAKINDHQLVPTRHHDQLVHPGRRHHVYGDAVRSGNQQKVTALSSFEIVDLWLGEVERFLQLGRLGMLLRAQ